MEQLFEFAGNNLFLICLWLAIAILLIWNLSAASIGGAKSLNPAEVTRLVNRDDAVIIDLRKQADFAKGHIVNARHVPATQLDEKLDKLRKDIGNKPIILCCSNGLESQRCGKQFMQAGFEQVHLIKGGIAAWQQDNLPLVKS